MREKVDFNEPMAISMKASGKTTKLTVQARVGLLTVTITMENG